jgi:hypothetical protein
MTTKFIVYTPFVFNFIGPVQPYRIVGFRQEGEMWPYGRIEFRLYFN